MQGVNYASEFYGAVGGLKREWKVSCNVESDLLSFKKRH